MISCDTVKVLLSDYIEDTIDLDTKSTIQSHLNSCLDCKRVFTNVQLLTQRLKAVSPIKISADFDQKLRSKIMGNESQQQTLFSVRNFSYGLSGAAILAVVYLFIATNFSSKTNIPIDPSKTTTISSTKQPVSSGNNPGDLTREANNPEQTLVSDTLIDKSAKVDESRINLVDQEDGH